LTIEDLWMSLAQRGRLRHVSLRHFEFEKNSLIDPIHLFHKMNENDTKGSKFSPRQGSKKWPLRGSHSEVHWYSVSGVPAFASLQTGS